MIIKTLKFGEIEVPDEDVITFSKGLPGFEQLRRFVLLRSKGKTPFYWLQSVDDGGVALVVINPYLLDKDYSFSLEESVLSEMGIEDTGDAAVFTVVVIPENFEKMTANFAAPIIINVKNRQGRQVILSGGEYGVRTPIYEHYLRLRDEEAV